MAKTGFYENRAYDAQDALPPPHGGIDPFAVRLYLNSAGARAADQGGSGMQGSNPGRPFRTLAKSLAVAKQARQGVSSRIPIYIFVAPNHAENIAAAQAVDVEHLSVVCPPAAYGWGPRPKFTCNTSTAAGLVVSADFVTVQGLEFLGAIASQVSMVTLGTGAGVGARDCRVLDCSFRTGGQTPLRCIRLLDTNNNRITIARNMLRCTGAVAGSGIIFEAASSDVYVEDNTLIGNWSSGGGGIYGLDTVAISRGVWRRNVVQNLGSGVGIGSAYDNAAVQLITVQNWLAAGGTPRSFGASALAVNRGDVVS